MSANRYVRLHFQRCWGKRRPEPRILGALGVVPEVAGPRVRRQGRHLLVPSAGGELDDQIDRVRLERQGAANAQEYERAASMRDQEKELLASRAGRQEQ